MHVPYSLQTDEIRWLFCVYSSCLQSNHQQVAHVTYLHGDVIVTLAVKSLGKLSVCVFSKTARDVLLALATVTVWECIMKVSYPTTLFSVPKIVRGSFVIIKRCFTKYI